MFLDDTGSLSEEFAMIKYSRAGNDAIPHERVFKLDKDNLVSFDDCFHAAIKFIIISRGIYVSLFTNMK